MSSVLLAGALTSCSGYFENQSYNPDWYKINDSNIPKWVDTPAEIYYWVGNGRDIEYKRHGHRCFFPQETLNNGYGDCDDLSVLAIAIYKARCDKKGSLLTGTSDGLGHAEPNFCGETFLTFPFTQTKEYPFDDIKYFPNFYAPN